MNIEILAWIYRLIYLCMLSAMVQVSRENIDNKWNFIHIESFFLLKFCIKLPILDQLIMPIPIFYLYS